MLRASMFLSSLAILMLAMGLSGCGGGGDSEQPETGSGDAQAEHEHGDGDHAGHMPATKVAEELAKLPDADRAVAEKQVDCPVTDEPLGSMGELFKVTHEGRDVFLCCEMCKDSFHDDPDKYLAKLNK